MVLMESRKRSSPRAIIFRGVSGTSNSARVALLTPASVACADSTTATRSVKGLRCSNSPFGSGLAFWKRPKASRTSASLQGLKALGFGACFDDFFSALLHASGHGFVARGGLAFALIADFFGSVRTEDFLAR